MKKITIFFRSWESVKCHTGNTVYAINTNNKAAKELVYLNFQKNFIKEARGGHGGGAWGEHKMLVKNTCEGVI